jgi:hypothetical protein
LLIRYQACLRTGHFIQIYWWFLWFLATNYYHFYNEIYLNKLFCSNWLKIPPIKNLLLQLGIDITCASLASESSASFLTEKWHLHQLHNWQFWISLVFVPMCEFGTFGIPANTSLTNIWANLALCESLILNFSSHFLFCFIFIILLIKPSFFTTWVLRVIAGCGWVTFHLKKGCSTFQGNIWESKILIHLIIIVC